MATNCVAQNNSGVLPHSSGGQAWAGGAPSGVSEGVSLTPLSWLLVVTSTLTASLRSLPVSSHELLMSVYLLLSL